MHSIKSINYGLLLLTFEDKKREVASVDFLYVFPSIVLLSWFGTVDDLKTQVLHLTKNKSKSTETSGQDCYVKRKTGVLLFVKVMLTIVNFLYLNPLESTRSMFSLFFLETLCYTSR